MSTPTIGNSLLKIGDVLRGSLIAERPEQIRPLCEAITALVIEQGGKFYIKNFWADPKPLSLGYVGAHIKIRLPIPPRTQHATRHLLMEVQLHVKAIMDGTKHCAKEIAHRLYKAPRETDAATISPHIISSSQLVYLTAMTRLLSSREDVERVERTIRFMRTATRAEEEMTLALETTMRLMGDRSLDSDWNARLKVCVPRNGEAVARAWKEKARVINEMINLPDVRMDENIDWTNTATSVSEIYADARAIERLFREMCERAARSQEGCSANFGPLDEETQTDCMIKTKNSLLEKMEADQEEEVGRFILALLTRIGRTWAEVTENPALPFGHFSQIQNLNFANRTEMTNDDLRCLKYFPGLQGLNLTGCNRITDEGLAHLDSLTRLLNLNLSNCSLITDSGLSHFWRYTLLQNLLVDGTQITDIGFARWQNSRNLSRQDAEPIVNQPLLQQSLVAADDPQPAELPSMCGKITRSLLNGVHAGGINSCLTFVGTVILEESGIEENQARYILLGAALLAACGLSNEFQKRRPTEWAKEPLAIRIAGDGLNFVVGGSLIWVAATEFGLARLGTMAGEIRASWLRGIEFEGILKKCSDDVLEGLKQPRVWGFLGMFVVVCLVCKVSSSNFDLLRVTGRHKAINIPVGMSLGAGTAALWGGDFATTITITQIASAMFSCLITMMWK